jgi:hypothetical protein
MKFAEVAENVKRLVETPPPKDEFIYALLLACGTPKTTANTTTQGAETQRKTRRSLAQLYDPDTAKRSEKECHTVTGQRPTSWRGVQMPVGLREAHHQLDLAVDRIYRSKPFASDEERLEHLFKLYEEMTSKEKLI